MNPITTIEDFRAYVAAEIGRDPEQLPFGADLRADADLDSIEMFLLVIAVEDLGARFPEEMLGQVRSLEDAYHHLFTQRGHRP
jgi:acyl carrier protein